MYNTPFYDIIDSKGIEIFEMDDDIKKGFRALTYGLYLVTAESEGKRNAMVASWVSQVSYAPPRIMVAVKKTRFSHKILESARGFGLMVIEKGRERELSRFKGTDPEEKFEGKDIIYGKGGAPLFSDYLCAFDIVTKDKVDAGDHTIFIGDVVGVTPGNDEGVPMSTTDYGKVYIGET